MKNAKILWGLLWAAGTAFGGQYVVNPDFEDVGANGVAVGWERAGVTFSVRKGEGYNGTRGLVYENNDPARYRFPFQKIGLKPGKRYLVTAKIRTENIQGKDIGAGVCVEFTAGGAYSKGFKGTTDGWVQVAFTSDIPAQATAESIVVAPFVRRGCTGKAWFDEVSVTDLERPPVETLTTSAYRNGVADGTVALVAALNLESTEGVTGRFEIETPTGPRMLTPEKFVCDCAAVRVKVADMPKGPSTVRFRLADAHGKTLAEKSLTFTRLVGPDRRRVRIDAKGRTLVDGKPFFPLGISVDPRDASCVDVIAKSPFNVISPSEAREEVGFYDVCAARGLMVRGNLGRYYADIGRSSEFASMEEAEKALRVRVEAVRNHPALLAWEIADEFPAHLAGVLEQRRALLERLDPDHPTYCCTCHPEQARHMLGAYEIAGSDPYPIGDVAKKEGVALAAKWARQVRQGLFGLRPLWQVPQIFDWIAHRRTAKGTRAPTYAEMRSMVWQAIAEGANGLLCYAYMSIKWADQLGRDPFEKRWADVCRVAAEVKAHADEILSGEIAPKIGALPDGLSARGWTKDGVKTVVLVNQNDAPLKGKLMVDGVEIAFDLKPLAVEFRNVNAPTVAGIPYGPDAKQAIDVWLPKMMKGARVPLVVEIHGGGWRNGTRFGTRQMMVAPCIRAKVALASISYRLIGDAASSGVQPPVKAPIDDAIAAVRFLKTKADEWHLDVDRIMLTGSSAGACSSLIAAFRDDCALGVHSLYVRNAQTSLDPVEMRQWIPNVTYGPHAFGCKDFDDWLARRAELMPVIGQYSPVALIDRCTPSKAPRILYLSNPVPADGVLPKDPTHAGMFSVKLHERCKARGIPCERVRGGHRDRMRFHVGEANWDQIGLDEALVKLTE